MEYNIVNGTAYHVDTPKEVVKALENARIGEYRIRIFYGDKKNGRGWNDEQNSIGTVGRSNGKYKIPLLIHSKRSSGGGAILDNCIIRIDACHLTDRVRYTVYKADNCRQDNFISTDIGNVYNETRDELYARCKNADAGKRLADFMNGKRWAK
jgi:hypothetical protein